MTRSKIVIPRELLLVEIVRRCHVTGCEAKTHIGLTRSEARSYTGFECERCKEWNVDMLDERDVPEWWAELAVTDLYALRKTPGTSPDEIGEVIARMSKDYRRSITEE